MLTKDKEKWKSLFSSDEQVLMPIEQHDDQISIIYAYKGTDEMSLEELSFLSQIIQHSKKFALVEIGKSLPSKKKGKKKISRP